MFEQEKFIRCQRCGNFIQENTRFCPYCNTLIKKKMSNVRIVFIVVCGFIGFVLLMSVFMDLIGIDSTNSKSNDSKSTIKNNTDAIIVNKDNTASMGEKMALESAKNYLRTMGFSRKGLIKQLEFEGYTTNEAIYAVNNCEANWKEQAVRVAKNYLNTMPFSREGLIEQLEFEGFTNEEAVYGVNMAYK